MKFNKRFKLLRKRSGLTQIETAEKLGMSQQTIAAWESGRSIPSIEMLPNICRLFGVSSDFLLGIDEPPLISDDSLRNAEAHAREMANWIRDLRNNRGLTQLDVADRLKIPLEEYLICETTGMADVRLLARVAELFDVAPERLIVGELPAKERKKLKAKNNKLLLSGHDGITLERELTEEQFTALADAINKMSESHEPK